VWGEALDGQIITNCPKCPNWAFKILSYKAWIIKGRWRYTICQSFSTTDTSAFGEGVWRGTTWTSRRYKRPSLSNAQTSLFDVTTTKNNTMTVLEVITMLSMVLLIKYSTWTKNYSVFVFNRLTCLDLIQLRPGHKSRSTYRPDGLPVAQQTSKH